MGNISINEILNDKTHGLKLRIISGGKGLERKVATTDVNRPQLALAGYWNYFAYKRIQVFGKTEMSYLRGLSVEERSKIFSKMFSYKIPCLIIARGQKPFPELIELAKKSGTVLLRSPLITTRLISKLHHYLEDRFAPTTTMHAGLVDVYGVGTLLLGESGIGKSECALELLERGHRVVADDIVDIKKTSDNKLIGTSSELIKHHMEVRGLGVISIEDLFGVSSICDSKEIDLVINLEEWNSSKEYDRLGLKDSEFEILDVKIPQVSIPVRPGRNIAVITEIAAMNHRLKKMGYHSAKELNRRLLKWMKVGGNEKEKG
ncbi:MAG: HPr(Ser) kinase/phosphatase [bacterium]|nr:HPr(Ser) kinase/phosphatase [bacterium]